MNPLKSIVTMITFAYGMLMSSSANAYLVGPSLPLDKLVEKADFICKAVVVASKPVEDAWFDKLHGFEPLATELKIVAVYKGANLTQASFRHYAPRKDQGSPYSPQNYEFVAGRTYLFFASKTDDEKVFRQITKNHTSQEDQGVLLAADDSPHPDKTMKQVFWLELSGLLKSQKPGDAKYGIEHLNRMSDGRWGEPVEFLREDVLKALLPMVLHTDTEISRTAIVALGTNNPLMSQDAAPGWLATIGKGHIPGFGHWDTKLNLGGQRSWKELASVADSNSDSQTRALAIRALGRTKLPELRPLVLRWIQDKDPLVAQAAVVLLSDDLGDADHDLLKTLSADPRPAVRVGVATAIGFAQAESLIPMLGKLVSDTDEHVSAAAVLSLLSFSLDSSEDVLKANLKHANFGPLFVNALAQSHGLEYANELCDIIRNNRQPNNWWGGFVVWGDSWNVLFKAAQAASKDELTGERFQPILSALEAPASGNPKSPTYYSSSEPRDLYALYVQKGLRDRAQAFRIQCKKTISYDIDYYLKMVDENPNLYTRDR